MIKAFDAKTQAYEKHVINSKNMKEFEKLVMDAIEKGTNCFDCKIALTSLEYQYVSMLGYKTYMSSGILHVSF